jgi:hypothetical protein
MYGWQQREKFSWLIWKFETIANFQLVCCPDNAVAPTTTKTTTTTAPQQAMSFAMKPTNPLLPATPNLDLLKNHRNYHLINEKKCGSSVVTDRIIGGEI